MNIMSARPVLCARVDAAKGSSPTAPKSKPVPTAEKQKERRKTDRRASPGDRRQPNSDRRAKRIFFRGTNLQPTGEKLTACLAGSKQSILVDMLVRPEGATMEELIAALSGGRQPWTEATVRSGFGWDLKRKGYGVRSEFDPQGEERFHLIVPKGQKVPAHVTREEARKRTAKKEEPAPAVKKQTKTPAAKKTTKRQQALDD